LQVLEYGGRFACLNFNTSQMPQFFGLIRLINMVSGVNGGLNVFEAMQRLANGENFLNPLEEEGARAHMITVLGAAGGAGGAGAVVGGAAAGGGVVAVVAAGGVSPPPTP
jgi:hypothetical protein